MPFLKGIAERLWFQAFMWDKLLAKAPRGVRRLLSLFLSSLVADCPIFQNTVLFLLNCIQYFSEINSGLSAKECYLTNTFKCGRDNRYATARGGGEQKLGLEMDRVVPGINLFLCDLHWALCLRLVHCKSVLFIFFFSSLSILWAEGQCKSKNRERRSGKLVYLALEEAFGEMLPKWREWCYLLHSTERLAVNSLLFISDKKG